MGLFSSSSKQSQAVTDTSSGASVAGDAAAPVSSISLNTGAKSSGTFNFLDAGSIDRSFDFADANQEKTFDFLTSALDSAVGSLNTSRDAIKDASTQSINAIAKAAETPEEKEGNRNLFVLGGVLLLVGAIFYFQNKGAK